MRLDMEPAIPILMYHHVSDHGGDPLTISPAAFEAQVRFLVRLGYRTLTLDELLAVLEGKERISPRSVVLTFDDGYVDFWFHGYPVLERYGVKAILFLVTSWVKEGGTPRALPCKVPSHQEAKALIRAGRSEEAIVSWEEVERMVQKGFVEVSSHTHTHPRWKPSEGSIDEGRLKEELARSKALIEERLGGSCHALCWPWGLYDEGAVKVAKEVGYRALFTTERGVVTHGSDPYALRRIVVKKGAIGWFASRLFIYSHRWSAGWYLQLRERPHG